MKKEKIIYFGLLIGIFIVSTMYFSYAFFTSINEEHGKLNIVAGTLNYKIEGNGLENNQITVSANNTKEITIKITSLNDIKSKYELYYIMSSGLNVDVGYNNSTTDSVSGEIEANSTKEVTISIRNNTSSTQTIEFGVKGGLTNNELVLTQGKSIPEFKIYAENILNGATPVLTDNLIPVEIANDGTVTKANLYNKWYSYEDKKWANAIVLKENYDENTIYDLSGNGNNATIYGATVTDEGLNFDGVDDYAKIDLLSWNSTTEFTIEFTARVFDNDDAVILFESSINSNKNYGSFYIDTNEFGTNDLTLAMKYNENGGYFVNHKQVNNIIDVNNYKTYTITFNSKNEYDNFINIYVDGIKYSTQGIVDSANGDVTGLTLNDYPFFIGARNGDLNFTSMTLKNLKIYTKELTEEEIQKNVSGSVITDNLILMYKLDNYHDNETILEDSIESYFVWIPKYSYQLWDLGDYSTLTTIDSTKPHAIPIKFGLTNTSDSNTGECTTLGVAGESGNCKVGDYMTHPAFLAFDSNGFWVGKFETGYDGATTTIEAEVDSSDSNKIIIKPNVYSWRNLTLGNMFKASYDYLRNDESHMMKNTEWGAVAYLSHSVYGINDEIRINNNSNTESSFLTGYSAINEPTCGYGDDFECHTYGNLLSITQPYNTEVGYLASTTKNISGVYDMSGGAWDYTAGYSINSNTDGASSGITSIYSDFFTNSSWDKYYDKYSSTASINYNNRILGDATGELGPFYVDGNDPNSSWYKDWGYFLETTRSWFVRGACGNSGIDASQFTFFGYIGIGYTYASFRVVLTPTE